MSRRPLACLWALVAAAIALCALASPAFADYIPFGTLQWTRCVTTTDLLAHDDPVSLWFERMLDLYDGLGRRARRPISSAQGVSA